MRENILPSLDKNHLITQVSKTTDTAMEFLSIIDIIGKAKIQNNNLCEIHEICLSIATEYSKVASLITSIANGSKTKSESIIALLLESLFSYEESMRSVCVKINRVLSL